ncbi:MAG: PilZ domain-containing protein [Thermodesulfovibrionales bacterium]|nr:PilZ domain-containing protein [Thermodesulfovibrionales bacterium]
MSSFYSSRHERTDIKCRVEYILDLVSNESFEGMIGDISESGFSLFTDQQLEVGQEITIKTDLYLPSQSGVVQWVKPDEEGGYIAGLQF